MSPDLKDQVAAARDIVQLFHIERVVYLTATIIAVVVLLASAAMMAAKGRGTSAEFIAFFSSSGVFLGTAAQVLRMFNRVMNAILPEAKP